MAHRIKGLLLIVLLALAASALAFATGEEIALLQPVLAISFGLVALAIALAAAIDFLS